MTLQLEVGKYYRNRKGDKVGPIAKTPLDYGLAKECPFCIFFDYGGVKMSWGLYGEWGGTLSKSNSYDLIEEWKDEESKTEVYEVDLSGFKDEHDTVNHPQHYGGDTPYETIKVMKARLTPQEFVGACKFNVYKYNDRAKQKGCELENYKKAQFYQNALVDFLSDKA